MGLGRFIKTTMRTIVKWSLREDLETKHRYDEPAMAIGLNMVKSDSHAGINANGLHFTIYPATGGKVVEFKIYDPRLDRHQTNLYVVTDKEDLGEELGQIITKESLCR